MKIELKNVKHSEFASHETNCFEASIYIDGKKTGTIVSNGGFGGCNDYFGGDAYERISAYAKTLPQIKADFNNKDGSPFYYSPDADSLISDVLAKYLSERDLKRHCRTRTCFRIPNEEYKNGQYHSINRKFSPEIKEYIVNKYGSGVVILNEVLK